MKFDLGDILTRSWQISWKHKKLWGYAVLPFIAWMLYFPFFILFFAQLAYPESASSLPLLGEVDSTTAETIFLAGSAGITLLALFIQLFSTAALTMGVVRAESGQELPGFFDLFRDSLRYVGAIFGATLLIGLIVTVVFIVFMACSSAVSMITLGIGSIFLQFLLYPIMFVVWVSLEQTQAGIVADNLGATDAISRSWDLFTSHLWKYLLVGVVLYVVRSMIAGLMMFPMMVPMWALIMNSAVTETAPETTWLVISGVCMAAVLPVYVIFMGFSTAYTRSAFVVLYRRLTRDSQARQEFLKAIESQESK